MKLYPQFLYRAAMKIILLNEIESAQFLKKLKISYYYYLLKYI